MVALFVRVTTVKMFGFMKKSSVDKEREKEEKEKKKKEKKEKKDRKRNSTTSEELARLEEAKKGLFWRSNGAKGMDTSVTASESNDSLSSSSDAPGVYTTTAKVEISKTVKVPPRTQPKPQKPRGILKGRSNYGPEIPNQGVRGNLDDTVTVEENTYENEVMSGKELEMRQKRDEEAREARKRSVKSMIREIDQTSMDAGDDIDIDIGKGSITQRSFTAALAASDGPPPLPVTDPPRESEVTAQQLPQIEIALEPGEKSYENIDLQLPNVAPPRCPKPREIHLKRQPAGDYGFILRRGTVLQRDGDDTTEQKRRVIFAEPGPKNLGTGLLPGDRLIEVDGFNVEGASREDIIVHIRKSGASVSLKVQPIPELSELSLRSGLEGEDVEIQESSVSSGTLKRSGSMRIRNKQAKSEEQLATEKAWLSAERVWLVHKGGFAAARLQRISDGGDEGEGKCRVKLDFGGEIVDVEEDDVEKVLMRLCSKCNPPQYDRVEDLASLRYLNESSVLHTLRQRYGSNLIHSYGGSTLLIVNPMHPLSIYSENVIQMFRGCKQEDMPPHVYAIAQIAYRTMQDKRQDQSIVFLGRSGSGKTTNARHVLHYYTLAAASPSSQSILNADKLNSLFTVLDAFGSSRTIMNTSATRYVQLTSLDFDQSGQIAGASVQVLMLEKSRVARRPEGEPTFHVFYQMLAGIDSTLRKDLQLENLNEPNLFMTPLQRTEDRQRAQQAWAKIMHSMTSLLMSQSEINSLVAIMAAIYHLGVAGVTKGPNQKNQFARPGAAQRAAHCLGCSAEELSRNVFQATQTLQTKSSFRGTPDKSPSRSVDTLSGIECLEGFVIGLYSEVFSALLSLINRSLSSNARTLSSILLLDPPGFQNPFSCGRQGGASFEDLCHNYLQERLQLLFHEKVFTSEQDLYAQENIDCDFELLTSSPAPMVSLFDKASSQALVRSPNPRDSREADERGLLWILDEEAILQGSTEESFVQRLIQNLGDRQETKESLLRRNGAHSFTINHFQGTNPVTYSVKGWLRLCRENPVSRGVSSFLQDSQREEVRGLFCSVRGSVGGAVSGSIVGMEGTSSLRRTASMRRTFTTGTASLKRRSLCVQVKFQADSIIDTIRRSQAHFIHCVLPQNNAGLCDLKNALTPAGGSSTDDIMMNIPLVRAQLRGSEVLEAIRIHRHVVVFISVPTSQ
ncbi:hypothetical protein CAPTEDRAFT_191825 [Capitella teleta]|uniref:Myosin motor domain-containing protein n=1 Tax=Capitella teleta TaxID=283909 RepID=R7TXY8_CAPTE|nr:hypothetical protein CAPTEDRAFT_191825 [Capitella teleta]|eukprot:ELT98778.1 hypothetical protein CAPTEDRAFT_191825 [Capitella teleta]